MKYGFTVCSANYLPYAKSVGDSLLESNPEYKFIIFLLDTYQQADKSFFSPHMIIHAAEMNMPELAEMSERYTIFELSCAFKPFAANWVFQQYNDCELLFYFDSDILIFNSFEKAEKILDTAAILITPHLTTSKEYGSRVYLEKSFLRTGIYNAGFFGLKKSADTDHFLKWWMTRLRELCFNDVDNGLFVDQIWLNFVPVIFKNVFVLHDPGYNAAYWNIEERSLTRKGGNFFINESYPLVFFHYSGYNINDDILLSKYYRGFTFDGLPEFRPLFMRYRDAALKNNRDDFFVLIPTLGKVSRKKKKKFFFFR